MRVFLWIVLVVCIIAAGIFGYLLFSELIVDMRSQSFFNSMLSGVEFRPRAAAQDGSDGGGDGGGTGAASSEPGEWMPFVDFEALNEQYPGVVGWIVLDGTPINYPIMHHSNNNFFLNHLPDRTPNRSGSIYLDYRNESDFSDKIILIFGHHFSQSDSMFSSLRNYRNQEFFNANPIIRMYSPYADYEIELFAAIPAHASRDHPPLDFADEDEFLNYVRHIRGRSFVRSEMEIDADDRIVGLVTCQRDLGYGADGRLIIFGRLVRVAGIDIDGIGAP